MSEHDTTPCDGCGQSDDHPKIHVGLATWETKTDDGRDIVVRDPSFHFDCLPDQFRQEIATGDEHANTRDSIAKAESGVHGDDLRAYIGTQPSDNELPEATA